MDDIHQFFDSITGSDGSLLKLAKLLKKSLDIQKELTTTKFFKNHKINKIKELTSKALEIVDLFNKNTVYK